MSYNSGSTGGYAPVGNDVFVNASGQLIDGSGNPIALALNFRYDATNVATGVSAYPVFVTNGHNTAVGAKAISNQLASGTDDTCVGYSAGAVLTSGARNTYVGSSAGAASTNASDCTAVGASALAARTSVTVNARDTAVGSGALAVYSDATTGQNVAVGYQALGSATFANQDTAVGYLAGKSAVISGGGNVFVGWGSGNTSGNAPINNTVIGSNAGYQSNTANGCLVLGAGAFAPSSINSGNNVFVLGSLGTPLYGGPGNAVTTVGAAGGASALPATPLGYLRVYLNSTPVAIPYYNP